jgi:uncharacterized membrane protein YciS (DUF1049 family)
MSAVSLIFIYGMVVQIKQILNTKDTSSFSYTLIWGNTFALSVICGCMFSLGLIFSAVILVVQILSWAAIGFMKMSYDKKIKQ